MAVASHPPHRPVLAGTTAHGSYRGSTQYVITSGDIRKCRPRTPDRPWDTLLPALSQARVRRHSVLLGHRPSLHHLRCHNFMTPVRRLLRYYAHVRLLADVHARIMLVAFRADPGPTGSRIPTRSPGSRACSFSTCVRLLDYAGSIEGADLAMSSSLMLPSHWEHWVGTRMALFGARFLARRCLCLHFTRRLAAPSARLEVKMVRYSFLVRLFHPPLHAGLSRRLRSLTRAARFWISLVCRRLQS
jgi:hypothetical protein